MKRQLLTFCIGEQFLGVDIMAVREIRAWAPATLIPNAPDYVKGVVNLRGSVLPVIDLSCRLGWGRIDAQERHVIIVVDIGGALHGLFVDAVNDIVTVDDSELQAPPAVAGQSAADFLGGVASVDERMVMLLTLEKLADRPAGEAKIAA
jgi:purine-binding chemotaxis protein CheW